MTQSFPYVPTFSAYQRVLIAFLALQQFTVILDFMVLSPLGDILMKSLATSPVKFGIVASLYAFSAGVASLLAAGFADQFDRKKLLLFFYTGLTVGTLGCTLANNYSLLLATRTLSGLFTGVIGWILLAIIAEEFVLQQRGRVMGIVQMAFAVSQILIHFDTLGYIVLIMALVYIGLGYRVNRLVAQKQQENSLVLAGSSQAELA